MCCGQSLRLSCGLISTVGESFELILVDLLDDGVIHRSQNRLLAREVLVKVIDIPFGFLQERKSLGLQLNSRSRATVAVRSAESAILYE